MGIKESGVPRRDSGSLGCYDTTPHSLFLISYSQLSSSTLSTASADHQLPEDSATSARPTTATHLTVRACRLMTMVPPKGMDDSIRSGVRNSSSVSCSRILLTPFDWRGSLTRISTTMV